MLKIKTVYGVLVIARGLILIIVQQSLLLRAWEGGEGVQVLQIVQVIYSFILSQMQPLIIQREFSLINIK